MTFIRSHIGFVDNAYIEYFSSEHLIKEGAIYQVVQKSCATYILLNCGKIIIVFIECTDLRWRPHAARGHANFVGLYKKILN